MGTASAPRPGGRTAARRGSAARGMPTHGNTALKPVEEPTPEPVREHGTASPKLRVAPPLPVMVPRAPFIALVLVLVVGGVLGILVLNTKINENSFRLHDLRQRQADLDQRQQELEQQLADYESPNNLAAAGCKLGLVSAGAPAFIRLPDGRQIGVPQPASGEPCVSSQQNSGQQAAGQQGANGQQTSGEQRASGEQTAGGQQQTNGERR